MLPWGPCLIQSRRLAATVPTQLSLEIDKPRAVINIRIVEFQYMRDCIHTPVVLIIFKRPDLTARVLAAIAQARPSLLLVIADGPRAAYPEEAEKCRQTRALLQSVNWPCEVRTCFSDTNMACGRRVATGLDWVFNQVEQAIILEDDCVAHPSFFGYCQELLERYRDEPRIMQISGNNFQPAGWRCPYSYYFSRRMHVWGWATWRRAWRLFDADMLQWPSFRDAGRLTEVLDDPFEVMMWQRYFDANYKGRVDVWDTQWIFACWLHGGLSITPAVNLVSNIGFRADATHTTWQTKMADRPTADIGELRHPPGIEIASAEDAWDFLEVFNGRSFTRRNRLHRRLARLPARLLQKWFCGLDLWS